jgi:hypothetical protein
MANETKNIFDSAILKYCIISGEHMTRKLIPLKEKPISTASLVLNMSETIGPVKIPRNPQMKVVHSQR